MVRRYLRCGFSVCVVLGPSIITRSPPRQPNQERLPQTTRQRPNAERHSSTSEAVSAPLFRSNAVVHGEQAVWIVTLLYRKQLGVIQAPERARTFSASVSRTESISTAAVLHWRSSASTSWPSRSGRPRSCRDRIGKTSPAFRHYPRDKREGLLPTFAGLPCAGLPWKYGRARICTGW